MGTPDSRTEQLHRQQKRTALEPAANRREKPSACNEHYF